MSRLQKKCFLGATGLHCFLLLALIFGPGFFTKPTVENSPVLEFIPMMAAPDNTSVGGGSPRPPANPTPPVTPPQPTPPTPAPPPPEVKPAIAEPVKPEPVRINRPDPEALPATDKPKRHQVQRSTRVVKIANNKTPQPNRNTTTAKADDVWRKAVENAGKNISSGLASSTKVDMPEGRGGGGVSYAPYGQIVRKIYTDAWLVPDDMTDDEATIKVSVTIARDGRVIASSIQQRSGSAAADRSIQNTLDRITTIGVPFPTGAKESQRTFIMTFNLKAKKAFG